MHFSFTRSGGVIADVRVRIAANLDIKERLNQFAVGKKTTLPRELQGRLYARATYLKYNSAVEEFAGEAVTSGVSKKPQLRSSTSPPYSGTATGRRNSIPTMNNSNPKADWLALVAIEREFPGLASSGPMPKTGLSTATVDVRNPKHSGVAMKIALEKLTDRHRSGLRGQPSPTATVPVKTKRGKKRRPSFKRQRAGSL